jgi:CBS domain containing-hemolysin-like protein
VLYLKDLVTKPRSAGQIELENWRQRIRMPYYVQPTQRVGKVFEEMKRKRQHLAIVQDAQAQIVGLVTLQDIIEYIFGDLQEEQDAQALRYITEGAGRFVMDGNMPLPALAKLLGIAPHVLAQAQEQSETLGGLLVSLNHGKTPTKGSMWEWAECRLEVLAIMGSAVQQVRAERLRTVEAASTNAPPPPTPNPAG